MFENNVIKFGYGTVLVYTSELTRTVILKHIQPPKEIGILKESDLNDIEIIDTLKFKYDLDMREFYELLSKVNEQNPTVNFREYIFDFSNYNEESLKVVKEGFKKTIRGNTLYLAC